MNSLLMIQHNNEYLATFDWHQKLDVCLCLQLTTHLQINVPKIVGNSVPFFKAFIYYIFFSYIYDKTPTNYIIFFYYMYKKKCKWYILITLIEFTHSTYICICFNWIFNLYHALVVQPYIEWGYYRRCRPSIIKNIKYGQYFSHKLG
jgi:hypothetical protein